MDSDPGLQFPLWAFLTMEGVLFVCLFVLFFVLAGLVT